MWLLRPVMEGCLSLEALHEPRLGLFDIAMLNDALDVRAENERRDSEKP
jgi:hypothetical protein